MNLTVLKMQMHKGIIIFLVSYCINSSAQKVYTVDMVKVNGQYEKEAMYFYEQNWLAFRKEAVKKKAILGFEFLKSEIDSTNHFEITLITKYKNKAAYSKAEENFRPIMQSINPNGPKYLNDVKRNQFVKHSAGSEGTVLYRHN